MEPAQSQGATPPSSGNNNRTIAKDIARLIKFNKISKKELDLLDPNLRAEAISYASMMGDEEITTSIRKQSAGEKPHHPVDPTLKLRQTHISAVKEEVKVAPPPPKPTPPPSPPKPVPPPPPPPKPVPPPTPPPPTPKPTPPPVMSSVEEDKINASLKSLLAEKDVIDKEMAGLTTEKNDLMHTINSIRTDEKNIEDEEARIRRELEESIPLDQKKNLEEKRWALEDKRQVLEKSRWENRSKEDALNEKIHAKKKQLNDIESKQNELYEQLKRYNLKRDADKAKKELVDQQAEQVKILDRKKKYEADWTSINNSIHDLETKIDAKKKEFKEINKEFEEIEKKEHGASDEIERHKLEEKRWGTDKTVRDDEKEIWKLEDEMNKKIMEKKDLEQTFASIQTEEEDILDKIQQSKALIHRAEKAEQG